MAARAPLPLPLASVEGLSKLASDERLVNGIVEVSGSGQNKRAVIYGRPGLTEFSDCSSPCRGLLALPDRLLAVHGTTLYSVDTAGAATAIGTIAGSDPVIMAHNANLATQALIVCDAGVYKYQSGAVSLLGDPDLPAGAVGVVFFDQYFILPLADGRFFWTGINDTTVNALDFATAESDPDGLVGIGRIRGEIYLFGSSTIEVWANSGAASQPFERLPGGRIQSGCASSHTIVELEGSLFWLDADFQVARLAGGYDPQVISDRGVYQAVASIADKTTIQAFGFSVAGHAYYVLTSASWTWVYDASTGLWSEWSSKNTDCWRGVASELWSGRIIIGSRSEGVLWAIDESAYNEGDEEIQLLLRLPRGDTYPQGGVISQIDIDIETGVGRDDVPANLDRVNPQLTLRWSVDGGKTFKGGRLLEMGRKGEYTKRVRSTRLGSFKDKGVIFQIETTSPVFRAVLGASILAEPLDLG